MATESAAHPSALHDVASPTNGPRDASSLDGGSDSMSNKTRSYSSDDSGALGSPTKTSSHYTLDSEEDEEIRIAKEMALAIAQNPNMTPDQLREMQLKSKQRVAAAGKPMKAIRSSIKASMKAVSSVVPGSGSGERRKAPQRSTSAPKPQQSHEVSPISPPNATSAIAVPPASSPLAMPSSTAAGARRSITKGLGDFLDSQKEFVGYVGSSITSGFPLTGDGDRSSFSFGGNGGGSNSIRLTGIIWKRRSGLGKYSTTSAWERRRVVLQGTKVLYYKTLVDARDEETSGGDESEGALGLGDEAEVGISTPTSAAAAVTASWLGMRSTPSNGKESARGYLDLLAEHASVSASYGHTGAPTPFSLSIKVMSQTKWKLCFDTQEELMEWLAALTDVVVKGSVDAYNAQILEACDPRSSIAGLSGLHGQLSEPPRIAHADAKEATGGHRLWSTGHYQVKSENYPEENTLQEMIAEELEDVNSDDEDAANSEFPVSRVLEAVGTGELEFTVDPTTGKDIWGIPAKQVVPMVVLLNIALCLSRASALSVDMFWHLITFTNIALLGVLSKEKVGGTVVPKATISRKLIRRLSSGLGLPVPSTMTSTDIAKVGSLPPAPTKEVEIPEPCGDFKPIAGSTSMRIENPTDLPVNKDGEIFAGWRTADPSIMQIRSVGYKKNKAKVESPGQLYKCVNVDIFESRTRFPDMASRVTLPKVDFQDKGSKTWNAPDIFVITIAIPTDPPKLYGDPENGGGFTITIYFAMEQETRDILKRVTADGYNPSDEKKYSDSNISKVNAVRLLEEWCRRAPTDDSYMARFKVLPYAQNLKEIGLPSWIAKYNGKPFLIKRPGQTGFLYRHPEMSVVEFDISLHPFPYLAKQGICYMKDTYFKKVLVTFGFLIEGRTDDELPECLIGLFQLCYPDPTHAIQGEDFFAGKSPSSV